MEFVHIGVPTTEVQPDEIYAEGMKVHITDPEKHEYKFEYLRFDPDTWLPEAMQKNPHIAIKIDDIEKELAKCQEVLVEPVKAGDMTLAFGIRDGVIFEFMQMD